ncbi:YidC/Oxa1 family membrane protein insertase [Gandjariella thermophila]|nr:YidC/Oxa1 family membrane protein insertase [Gandjariella thermophila]
MSGAYHLVAALAGAVHPLLGGASTAAAIMLFTAAVRLLLHPLVRAQVRAERARAALQPEVDRLRRRHRDQPERLQRELVALHRRHGVPMFAGCLPTLLQLPFFSVTYRLFSSPTVGGVTNALLGHTLFGVPLGAHLFGSLGGSGVLVFAGLAALLAVVAALSSVWLARTTPATAPAGRLLRLLPFGTVLAAAVLPLAAGLYLLTSTTWTLVERAALRRRG